MSKSSYWIRLNIDWDDSGWIAFLSPGAQLAWIKLLCHVKRDGKFGRCKAVTSHIASRNWLIKAEEIREMIEAAIKPWFNEDTGEEEGPALIIEDGFWVVVGWSTYQNPEARRKHASRERAAQKSKPSMEMSMDNPRMSGTKRNLSVTNPECPGQNGNVRDNSLSVRDISRDSARVTATATKRKNLQAIGIDNTGVETLHGAASTAAASVPERVSTSSPFSGASATLEPDQRIGFRRAVEIEKSRQKAQNPASAPGSRVGSGSEAKTPKTGQPREKKGQTAEGKTIGEKMADRILQRDPPGRGRAMQFGKPPPEPENEDEPVLSERDRELQARFEDIRRRKGGA